MATKITGIFDTFDTAEYAVRNLDSTHISKYRIIPLKQKITSNKIQNFDTIFTDYPADTYAYGGVGQGLDQSIVISPSFIADPGTQEPFKTQEVQLELLVDDGYALIAEEKLINNHAFHLQHS